MTRALEVLQLLEMLRLHHNQHVQLRHGHHNQHVRLRHALLDIHNLRKLLHAVRKHWHKRAWEVQRPVAVE